MTEAITPSQALAAKQYIIPLQVLEAINRIIARKFDGRHSFRFSVDDVIEEAQKLIEVQRHEFFQHNWLDFEPIYEAKGWKVTFERKDYTESGPDWWLFEVKKDARQRASESCELHRRARSETYL